MTTFQNMNGQPIIRHSAGVLVGEECYAVEIGCSGREIKREGPYDFRTAVMTAGSMARVYGAEYVGGVQYA